MQGISNVRQFHKPNFDRDRPKRPLFFSIYVVLNAIAVFCVIFRVLC